MVNYLKFISFAVLSLAARSISFTVPTVPGTRSTGSRGVAAAVYVSGGSPVSIKAELSRALSSAVVILASPDVLEKPAVTKKKTAEPVKEKKRQGSEGWEVRLYNDPMNKREFVARCLTEITGLSDTAAYQVMMQAHQFGIAVVGRYHHERAEMYRNLLIENGLVCDMVPVDDDE